MEELFRVRAILSFIHHHLPSQFSRIHTLLLIIHNQCSFNPPITPCLNILFISHSLISQYHPLDLILQQMELFLHYKLLMLDHLKINAQSTALFLNRIQEDQEEEEESEELGLRVKHHLRERERKIRSQSVQEESYMRELNCC